MAAVSISVEEIHQAADQLATKPDRVSQILSRGLLDLSLDKKYQFVGSRLDDKLIGLCVYHIDEFVTIHIIVKLTDDFYIGQTLLCKVFEEAKKLNKPVRLFNIGGDHAAKCYFKAALKAGYTVEVKNGWFTFRLIDRDEHLLH